MSYICNIFRFSCCILHFLLGYPKLPNDFLKFVYSKVHSLSYKSLWIFDKCIVSYIHHYSSIQNSFIALKICCTSSILSFLPFPELLATTDPFIVFIVCHFPECHLVGIMQYLAFPDWHLSHSNMCLKSLLILLYLYSSLIFILLLSNIPL